MDAPEKKIIVPTRKWIFRGREKSPVDSKRRTCIPAVIRQGMEDFPRKWTLLLWDRGGAEPPFLIMFPVETAMQLYQCCTKAKFDANQDLLRRSLANSVDVDVDSLWRLTLPKELAEKAKISMEVFYVSAIDYVELWNPGLFEWRERLDNAKLAAALDSLSLSGDAESLSDDDKRQ
jgi:DNA-binding transcriptional regulator/RsmH inhibitor MraZ